ncbi:MAG: ABC transporter permease [Planctomycetes bacterium]|nr:ABC transporter permease [Planctomycetota bacterium]
MTARDGFRFAFSNLWQQKVRSALTTVGVVIGVGAVVLMVSGGIGVKRQILKQFESVDAMSSMLVLPIKLDFGKLDFGPQQLPERKALTDAVIADLKAIPGVRAVYPNIFLHLALRSGKHRIRGELSGLPLEAVTEGLRTSMIAGDLWKEEGEFLLLTVRGAKALGFDPPETAVGQPVQLMVENEGEEDGPKEAPPDGPHDPPPGGPGVGEPGSEPAPPAGVGGEGGGGTAPAAKKSERLHPFVVTGIYDADQYKGFGSSRVFLPMAQALKVRLVAKQDRMGFPGALRKGEYGSLVVLVEDPMRSREVSQAVRDKGFGALTADDVITQISWVFLILEGFLGCLGGVGLVVAFVGIVNTMLMSILERTREIGIMKAVGARSRDVRRIFLIEAMSIGLVGGGIGLTSGWLGGLLLNAGVQWYIASKGGPKDVKVFLVSWPLALAAMVFALGVSALAGVYPAMRAARLDPVRALRRE